MTTVDPTPEDYWELREVAEQMAMELSCLDDLEAPAPPLGEIVHDSLERLRSLDHRFRPPLWVAL